MDGGLLRSSSGLVSVGAGRNPAGPVSGVGPGSSGGTGSSDGGGSGFSGGDGVVAGSSGGVAVAVSMAAVGVGKTGDCPSGGESWNEDRATTRPAAAAVNVAARARMTNNERMFERRKTNLAMGGKMTGL